MISLQVLVDYLISFMYIWIDAIAFLFNVGGIEIDGANTKDDTSSQSKCPMAEVRQALAESRRSMLVTLAFKLIMGQSVPSNGFLMCRRTSKMQQVKVEVIQKMKARIRSNLGGQLHTQLQMEIQKLRQQDSYSASENDCLPNVVTTLTHMIVKKLLNLPDSLDLDKMVALGDADAFDDYLQEKGAVGCLLSLLGITDNVVPRDSPMGQAQSYLAEFLRLQEWSEDSFCADVVAVGQVHNLDIRAVLAELLSGAARNIAKIASCMVWNALYNPTDESALMFFQLTSACANLKDATDEEFVYGSTESSRMVRSWVSKTLQTYPNLHKVLRGSNTTVNLKAVATNLQTDAFVFAGGAFGCPGQTLVRTTLPLVIRCLFTKNNEHLPHEGLLPRVPCRGEIQCHYNNILGELVVEYPEKESMVPIPCH
jgi:hypothetical protein